MEVFLKEISFHGVMLDTLFDSPDEWKVALQRQVQENIDSGAIKPLVRTVFESDQVEQAFRYMAAGKHIGKVLIKIRSEEKESFIKPLPITKMAYPRVLFDMNSSCIICGNYKKKYYIYIVMLFI
jgi:fatty acid synthase